MLLATEITGGFSHGEVTKDFSYRPEPFEVGLAREVKEDLKAKR